MSTSPAASAALKNALSPPRINRTTLADELGVTPQAVSNWCSGTARPDTKYRARIEELTGVDRTSWLTDEEREAAGLPRTGEAA